MSRENSAEISVIIPVHNRSTLLERALKSVRAQTLCNLEIFVVDDHSTEDLGPVVEAHQPCLPNITLLKSQGRGVSAARNTGVLAATAPLIAFLDSDDEWVPEKLERQVGFLKQNTNLDLVHTDELWLRNGTPVKQLKKHQKSGGWIFERCTELCLIAPSSVLVRRSLFDRVGLFDEDFLVCEDFDLWLRITADNPVGFLNEPLTIKHAGHGDQLSMQYHSMDLWRVRALKKQLWNTKLSSAQNQAVLKSLKEKSRILHKGFIKHKNFEHFKEIEAFI